MVSRSLLIVSPRSTSPAGTRRYPDALAGDAIPLESRIIFVCDAFHAMTTERPYRSALSVEEAMRELRDGAGAQFDPAVVDVFLRLLQAS